MRQLDLGTPALLVLGSERRFPDLALCAIDHMRDGREVTLHHWLEQAPRELTVSASTHGLTLERRGLRIRQGSRGLALRWSDVFMLEVEGRPLVNLHRLYDLPVMVARRLIDGAGGYEPDRDSLRIVDALRRAMARAPWGFGGTFYAPTFIEQLDARAADTRRKLRLCDEAERDDVAPVCAYSGYRVQRATEKPTAEESEAFLAAEREQPGVDRIRGTVVPP